MNAKKSALGRGLGALIEDVETNNNKPAESVASINEIDIHAIEINPFQPRKTFDEDALQELASSIRQLGIIQPITVRKINGEKFQLITGERRFRASQLAGLETIPAYVRIADDQAMLELALVENIQREDLDAIEVAISYQRLIDECNLTQENMSDRVGKKRSTIANYLRLLKLPAEIQAGIRQKKITMGHARALVNVEDVEKQLSIFHHVMEQDLSVR
jgi:ParB family chromosome partitioning protein